MRLTEVQIAIIGLGYVGLPLAIAFAKKHHVMGFDASQQRINELRAGIDSTGTVSNAALLDANQLSLVDCLPDLKHCNCFIITVPTPVDEFKNPDLSALLLATEMIAELIKPGDIVIYESTVYPGMTEDICVPRIEKLSGLTFNVDFFCGYSPERVNPGDPARSITQIKKIVSGSTPAITDFIDALYGEIIDAGTYKAESIQVAEAAKVIENVQRDLNIALVNELAILFSKMEIDTGAVLAAARTKWNFLDFRPGLVGGHCIGVDPYYLTHKAQSIGHCPELILAGRRLNDGMPAFICAQLIKNMLQKKIKVESACILIMGLTFKENCPDIRNSRVIDIITELESYGCQIEVYDPWVLPGVLNGELPDKLVHEPRYASYDAIVLAVAHDEFKAMEAEKIRAFCKNNHVIYDVKHVLPRHMVDGRL